jgi:hypothetical protein
MQQQVIRNDRTTGVQSIVTVEEAVAAITREEDLNPRRIAEQLAAGVEFFTAEGYGVQPGITPLHTFLHPTAPLAFRIFH